MPYRLSRVLWAVLPCLLAAWAAGAAGPVDIVREPLGDGAYAVMYGGKSLFLECRPPAGNADGYLKRHLADDAEAKMYAGRAAVAIPFARLEPATQRAVLLAVFKNDLVDARGWLHSVASPENLATLCEWLTGGADKASQVMSANRLKSPTLSPGQQVLFPMALLKDALKAPTPDRAPVLVLDPEDALIELDAALDALDTAAGELTYDKDKKGEYAVYRLKPGEALYTAVVVRFTDYMEPGDVLAACDIVQERSGIIDVHDMQAGQPIRIPMDMLSARYRPQDSRERQEYEAVVQEAKRLKGQVKTRDLEGVVVIVDPGHGGVDLGSPAAEALGLYEDEVNYDIACRVKQILESRTRAKVYMTLVDPDQGYRPSANRRFVHDTDEEVLTTPRYNNASDKANGAKVSANLRWCLANAVYKKETKAGVDPRKIVFTSFHCDALFNGKLRGTMVYIPGANFRNDYTCSGPTYNRYREVKDGGRYSGTGSERRRDEALSRNFASVVLDELGKKQIKRHLESDPIRSQIRQSSGSVYVPAVLRNNLVPTKVLIEAANLTNATDCSRLADPDWRQAFAEAYVNALLRFYSN